MVSVFKPANYLSFDTVAESIENDKRGDAAENAKVTNVDGILFNDDGLFERELNEPVVENWLAHDILDGIGEWMAVAQNEATSSYYVFSDSAGFCPVFYALVPGKGLVAAPNFYGVLAGIKSLGGSVQFDVANYAAVLSSRHVMFLNPTAWRTMAQEVRILRPDEALLVEDNRVRLTPRSTLSRSSGLTALNDYEECLEAGLSMARNSLRSLAKLGDIERILYLSGGVDSRLVLALLVEAGVEKEFKVFSSDPRSARDDQTRRNRELDLEIANTLREYYGMDWWVHGDRKEGMPFEFRESLAMTQGLRSNFDYECIPTFGMSSPVQTLVSLRGGGGEVLRGNWERLELLANEVNEKAGLESVEPADRLSAWYRTQGMIPFEGDGVVAEMFTDFLNGLGAKTDRELIVKYFQQTRNRTHFGHSRFTRPAHGFALNPLTNRFFLRAAELLEFEDLSRGKLIRDIFERCAPELLEFSFDNSWTNSWLLTADEPRALETSNSLRHYYNLIDGNKVRTTRSSKIKKDPRRYRKFDPEQAGRRYLERAFAEIEDRHPQFSSLLHPLHQEVWGALDSGRVRLSHLVVKAASAIDVYFPMIRDGEGITFSSQERIKKNHFEVDVKPWLLPLDGWNELGIVDQAPELDLTSNSLVINPKPKSYAFSSSPLRYELIVDGKIVEIRNSDGVSIVVFDWKPSSYESIVVRAVEGDDLRRETRRPIWEVSLP